MIFIRPLICSALLFTLLLAGCDPKHLNLENHNNSTDLAKLEQALKDYNASEVDSICQKDPGLGLQLNDDDMGLDLLVQNSSTTEALLKNCLLEQLFQEKLLSRAIFKRKKELVRSIIKQKPGLEHSNIPDPNAPNLFRFAPDLARSFGIYLNEKLELQLAIQNDEAAKVQSLCEDNPDLGLENNYRGVPFLSEVFDNSNAVLALLEYCYLPISFRDNQQNSLLITITKRLQTVPELEEVILKFIDKAPADYLEIKNNNHESVLSWAIHNDKQNIIDALLAKKADLADQPIAMPYSHVAFRSPKVYFFKKAMQRNDAAKVQSLCEGNPDLGLENNDSGVPFLSDAISAMDDDAVSAFVDYCRIPFSFRDDYQNSLLLTIIRRLQMSPELKEVVLKFIDKAPADYLEIKNRGHESALSWAIFLRKLNIAKAILKKAPRLRSKKIKLPYNPHRPAAIPIILGAQSGMDLSSLSEFDNEWASAKEQDGDQFYIKQEALKPIFIKMDGTFFDDKDVSDISLDEFAEVDYVLLPQSHWFAKLFIDNPFAGASASISLTRPSLWGLALEIEKEDKGSVLFSKKNLALGFQTLSTIDQADLDNILGDFRNHSLGSGGQGEVFSFSYKGEEYAVKEQKVKREIADYERSMLEVLQFTDAVIPVYASFMFQDKPFMIMKKGIKSLDKMNKNELSDEEILKALKRFTFLSSVQKKLDIENNDIKPQNMLLTNDGIKVIDISKSTTRNYSGSVGKLSARALIEARFGNEFLGTMRISLDQYYDFFDDSYRKFQIASDEYISQWVKLLCTEYHLLSDCTAVKSYEDIFPLFVPSQLRELGKELNSYYAISYPDDNSGTHDDLRYGNYKTGLAFPQLYDDDNEIDWQSYWDKKDQIGEGFCSYISSPSPKGFYKELRSLYKNHCEELPDGTYRYKNFNSEVDDDFKQLIRDAFYPIVKLNTFKTFSYLKHYTTQVLKNIFTEKFPTKPEIVEGLLKLYQQ